MSGVNNLLPNTGVTSNERGAIDQLTSMGNAGNPYASGTSGAVNNLLSGGNATAQNGALTDNLASYRAGMTPYTDPNYSTINTPAVQAALHQVQDDVTNQVNGQFAAAGRFGSGMNTQTLGRGIAQGEAPIILNQANLDTATRTGALNSLYGAGNTTSNAISGNNQTANANTQAGVNSVGTALTNSTWGPQTALSASELEQSLPASNLGLLAQMGIPLAGLGTTSNGTSNTTANMSPMQATIGLLGGLGKLFGGGA
ncbi:tail fiber domain-containing protein [Bradyrhizobium uaiense]|uniref:Tail fiber domain-containing protein n=1 Tax=Bradyrhizobium uaiense TaxID=2594946 RepID=A0A6P1B8W4_9BRAD|nr:tail fiber domain-containing protein [Bradyrhizobium uaiense]NEU94819.1 tail fiber domain-containing protein [Bradyrhizobium uaiense]